MSDVIERAIFDELISQLLAGDGVDHDLERRIALAIGWTEASLRFKKMGFDLVAPNGGRSNAPPYTHSLGAAVELYKQKPVRIPSEPRKCAAEALAQWAS